MKGEPQEGSERSVPSEGSHCGHWQPGWQMLVAAGVGGGVGAGTELKGAALRTCRPARLCSVSCERERSGSRRRCLRLCGEKVWGTFLSSGVVV